MLLWLFQSPPFKIGTKSSWNIFFNKNNNIVHKSKANLFLHGKLSEVPLSCFQIKNNFDMAKCYRTLIYCFIRYERKPSQFLNIFVFRVIYYTYYLPWPLLSALICHIFPIYLGDIYNCWLYDTVVEVFLQSPIVSLHD